MKTMLHICDWCGKESKETGFVTHEVWGLSLAVNRVRKTDLNGEFCSSNCLLLWFAKLLNERES